MSIKNTDNNTEDEDFDELLTELYEVSLFDESFQQQVIADIKQLPTEKMVLLNARTQAFIEEKVPPTELMDTIFADIAKKNTESKVENKKGLLQRFFANEKPSFSWLSPTVTVPTSLAFGMLFGVILAPLFNAETIMVRTGDVRGATSQTGELIREVETLTEDQNDQLNNIALLVYEGKIKEAEEALKKFKKTYPDFLLEK